MLGHPVDAPVLATIVVAVINQELRAISRKGQVKKLGILRDHTPDSGKSNP